MGILKELCRIYIKAWEPKASSESTDPFYSKCEWKSKRKNQNRNV